MARELVISLGGWERCSDWEDEGVFWDKVAQSTLGELTFCFSGGFIILVERFEFGELGGECELSLPFRNLKEVGALSQSAYLASFFKV